MYQALDDRLMDGGDNNGRNLVGMAKMWPRPVNRGLSFHSFLQLFRDFDYLPRLIEGGRLIYRGSNM